MLCAFLPIYLSNRRLQTSFARIAGRRRVRVKADNVALYRSPEGCMYIYSKIRSNALLLTYSTRENDWEEAKLPYYKAAASAYNGGQEAKASHYCAYAQRTNDIGHRST